MKERKEKENVTIKTVKLNSTCRLLYADGLHEPPVDLGAGILEVHVGLLR